MKLREKNIKNTFWRVDDWEGFFHPTFWDGVDNRILEGDERLGFRFPGGELISSKGFVSLNEVFRRIKKGRDTVLNMGDSSTSGYDSNRTFSSKPHPHDVFFCYKTYPDILSEEFHVNSINAGVPGYTAYQGRKYLELLLKRFAVAKITVDYVTIYFGNNDSIYNQMEDKVRLDGKTPSELASGERVTVRDYKTSTLEMIVACREYGVTPVIIVPPVRYNWEPGIRADKYMEKSLDILKNLRGSKLWKEIERAEELYKAGMFEDACEEDRVLPRLKKSYRKALLDIAIKTKTDFVDIQGKIPFKENSEYFVDYCHPAVKANALIAGGVAKIIKQDKSREFLSKKIKRYLKVTKKQDEKTDGPPSDIYPLY